MYVLSYHICVCIVYICTLYISYIYDIYSVGKESHKNTKRSSYHTYLIQYKFQHESNNDFVLN